MQKLKSQPESSGRNSLSEKMSILRDEIKSMEAERKQIALYLKKKGDGEISVTKLIYPNSCIILGCMFADIDPQVMAQTFYLKDGEIKML